MKNKIIEVFWCDSYSAYGWQTEQDLQDQIRSTTYKEHKSIGYLVFESKEKIIIAQSLGNNNYCNCMTIPRVAITKIKVIRNE